MARQFGDRICILSDSMISDSDATSDDVIPGQLKAIVINKRITIAYSGLVNKAINKIREIRMDILKGIPLEAMLEWLAKLTLDEKGEVDFIVASHISGTALYKITNGKIHSGSDRYWIGNSEAANLVQHTIDKDTHLYDKLPEYVTPDEAKFQNAFHEVIYQHEVPGVGGFAFYCLCSPYGHCYEDRALYVAWDTITLDGNHDETAQRAYDRTGTECYQYNSVSAHERGLAITGAYFGQNDIGYLYSPLDQDLDLEFERKLGKPKKYHPISLEEFEKEVQNHASRLESCLCG